MPTIVTFNTLSLGIGIKLRRIEILLRFEVQDVEEYDQVLLGLICCNSSCKDALTNFAGELLDF